MSIFLSVVDTQHLGDRAIVVSRVLKGEPSVGQHLRLGSENVWSVMGIGFAPIENRQNGMVTMNLRRISGNHELAVGDELYV